MPSFTAAVKVVLLNLILLVLWSCSDGGIDGGGEITDVSSVPGSGDGSVVISGKVSLSGSSALSSKTSGPVAPSGKPGSRMYMSTRQEVQQQKDSSFLTLNKEISSASVFLYDAGHPEWLYPVASASTNTNGDYTLNLLSNAEYNLDSSGNTVYVNGDPIPEGQYTLLAFRPGGFDPVLGVTTDPVVALQTVVNTYEAGVVSTADLAAQSSTVKPKVSTIVGLKKNTDGTQTWGSSAQVLPTNASIQVTFSMAMSRASVLNGVSISPDVSGTWKVSSDWLSATFYPESSTGLAQNTTYTVTANGEDGSGTPVTNVYGNSLAKTAVGTFSTGIAIDDIAPVVTALSPSGGSVDIVTPIRIQSDEILDINSLQVTSTPTLGAKPGVLFIGKDATSGLYKYEFVLANPLLLGTTYNITVSGGTDIAGNSMATLNFPSFTTTSTVAGVDSTADTSTQAIQAEVLDVFGRWVRSMDDRNITQLQSMMTGDYVFEYDVSNHGPNDEDLNRDGRLDLQEFTEMISNGFTHWDYCETEIIGDVAGNVNVIGSKADFEFSLTFASANTTQDCTDSPGALFATVHNINGTWLVGRVSDGIDTRDRELEVREVMTGLSLVQNGVTVGSEVFANLNGATLIVTPQRIANVVDYPTEFKWKAVTGATAYVFYVVNARDDDRGRAFILPSSMTSWKMPRDIDATTNYIYMPPGVVEATKAFGFWESKMELGMTRNGEEFYWTVMALDNNVPSDFDVDGDREYDPRELTKTDGSVPNDKIDESRATKLFQQISAVSRQYRFKNPGVYKALTVSVKDGSDNLLTYSELFDGYEAFNSDQLSITITTPNDANDANTGSPYIKVNGHSWKQYSLTFTNNGDGTASAAISIDLFNGHNWIDIYDGADLWKNFGAVTTGGKLPVIQNIKVTDQNSNIYTPDTWGYINTGVADITSLIITGDLVDSTIGASLATSQFNVNLWNDSGANSSQSLASVTDSFSIQLPVYQGNNWINMDIDYCDTSGSPCDKANFHLGIYTTTGTPYAAPIHTINVVNGIKTDDYGNSQNWDASADTDNSVVISGVMEFTTGSMTPTYNVSSDGEWFSKTLTLNADGLFQIPVNLYNGWNYVDMYDASGNWFNVAVYTTAGQVVLRPQILTLSNSTGAVTYNGSGNFTTDQCSVAISGKAMADSEIEINWNGDDGAGSFYHERSFTLSGAAGTDGLGSFSATIPLISGGYNNIDIFDANYRGAFVQVNTTASCVYSPPVLTMTDVTGNASTTSTFPLSDYSAAASTTVTIRGTTDDYTGRKIVGTNWACNGAEKVETVADGSGNWTMVMNVYQDYNNLEVTDGVNHRYFNVQTTNSIYPTPRMTAEVQGYTANYNGCGYIQYNLTSETTVVVNGTTTAQDGTGQYWDADGTMQTFTISGGAFSFSLSVYEGWNYISIDDSEFNHFNVDVYTTNGNPRPRYIEITSPLHDATISPQTITVTGSVDVANFPATNVRAYVYDETARSSVDYSSDSYEITSLGRSPISYDSGTGAFSFAVVVSGTNYVQISIDGYDNVTFTGHGHSVTVNNVNNYGEYSYKQGSGVVSGGKSSANAKSQTFNSVASKARAVRALIKARRQR